MIIAQRYGVTRREPRQRIHCAPMRQYTTHVAKNHVGTLRINLGVADRPARDAMPGDRQREADGKRCEAANCQSD